MWHASPIGLYESQDPEQADMNLRGKFTTDADGRFWFNSVKMVGYPIPTDGVVGRLLTGAESAAQTAGASARPDLQARLQGADFAGLRSQGPQH